MTMTTKQALAERERLRTEAGRIREALRADDARIKELQTQRDALPKRREQAMTAAARTGEPANLDRFDEEAARVERELDHTLAQSRVSARVAQTIEGGLSTLDETEIRGLHRREFAAFAEHAEKFTEAAHHRLAELREPYEAAYRAWQAAAEEWRELARDNGLHVCPPCPLPAPQVVFGPRAVAARPPGLSPVADEAA